MRKDNINIILWYNQLDTSQCAQIQINEFVDANRAGELTAYRSQTEILINGNMTPLIWLYRTQ